MASPSPVLGSPPLGRLLSCAYSVKSLSISPSGIPGPVSLTSHSSQRPSRRVLTVARAHAVRAELDGVADEVLEHLHEAEIVRADVRQVPLELHVERDALALRIGRVARDCLAHDRAEVGGKPREPPPTVADRAQLEEVPDDALHEFTRLDQQPERRVRIPVHGPARRVVGPQPARHVEHEHERLLEVVARDPQEAVVRLLQAPQRELRAHPCEHDGEVEGLGDVVVRAGLERPHDVVRLVEAGDDDDRQVERRVRLAQPREEIEAAAVGETDVEQDQVEAAVRDPLPRLVRARGDYHSVAFALEFHREHVAHAALVVHDQQPVPALRGSIDFHLAATLFLEHRRAAGIHNRGGPAGNTAGVYPATCV